MAIIPAFRRLIRKQEDYHEFEGNLSYTVSFRTAWATG